MKIFKVFMITRKVRFEYPQFKSKEYFLLFYIFKEQEAFSCNCKIVYVHFVGGGYPL